MGGTTTTATTSTTTTIMLVHPRQGEGRGTLWIWRVVPAVVVMFILRVFT